MVTQKRAGVVLIVFLSIVCAARGESIPADGGDISGIVIKDASEAVQSYCAEDLQRIFKLVSGKEIDIGHAWVEVKFPGYGWIPIDITNEDYFMSENYYLDITTERGPGYLYENTTMDWSSYYYDGFLYSWNGSSNQRKSKRSRACPTCTASS